MDDQYRIAERLRAVRALLGHSQRAMAEKIGCSARAMAGYENGDNLPGGQILQSMAGLGIDIHWLLTGEGSMVRLINSSEEPMPVDQDLLQMVIEEIELFIAERNLNWTADKKSRVIISAYDMLAEEQDTGEPTKPTATLARLLKAAV